MLAIFVEVVREVLVAMVWIALGTAAVGIGVVLVVVALALALRDARHDGDWLDHLRSTGRLLFARGSSPAAGLASLPAGMEPHGPPTHPTNADPAPHAIPDRGDQTRWRA